jgi:hypothetical protein
VWIALSRSSYELHAGDERFLSRQYPTYHRIVGRAARQRMQQTRDTLDGSDDQMTCRRGSPFWMIVFVGFNSGSRVEASRTKPVITFSAWGAIRDPLSI